MGIGSNGSRRATQGLKRLVLRQPKRFGPRMLELNRHDATRLWHITTDLASKHGLLLP
ncbi:hypothetical protein BN2476_210035 [Paraburkholderia piptadeniae]|uniref:Uncharacterized protein n=1 Tax=Paraburkholderia piptadeniae TaxID=1701573 RepID=A0A1N7RVG9_9BURK|nr:hypothetical protein BN2476_210035 [Paraburkholderia piptadeniae]